MFYLTWDTWDGEVAPAGYSARARSTSIHALRVPQWRHPL